MMNKTSKKIAMVFLLSVPLFMLAGCKAEKKEAEKTAMPLTAEVSVETNEKAPDVSKINQNYAKDIQADLDSILGTSKKFVKQGNFSGTFSDIGAVLALNDNPDLQKNTLAKFLKNALRGLAANADINNLKGLMLAVSSMEGNALQGEKSVSAGLVQMMERNMYGQLKSAADVKISSLRSLLFMLQGSDVDLTLKILGINTRIPLLYFVDSPDHPDATPGTVTGITKNVAGWAIGEIVTAQQWGREGKIKFNGRYVSMDKFEALDWVFYKKKYHFKFAGLTLMKFDGLVGLMSDTMVQLFMPSSITDPFPAFVDLAGGMTDQEYHEGRLDGFTEVSWKERYGTAGRRHKLFALFAPIMEYYWSNPYADGRLRSGEMVAMLAGLNEIDPSEYRPLKRWRKANPRATFRQSDATGHNTVMQTLEETGLLTVLLKKDREGDGDMLAPALDLVVSITKSLNAQNSSPAQYKKENPEFKGDTFFDIIFAELNLFGLKKEPEDIDRLIEKVIKTLFEVPDGESKNYVAKLNDLVGALAEAANDKIYMKGVREDLVKIIQAAQNLIYSDDFERILPGIDKLLALNNNPDPRKNTLARFLKNVLNAAVPISDGGTIKGLLLALRSVDKSAMEARGISEGIIYMAHHNMYAQKREKADVNTSQLRSFFILIDNLDRHMPLTVSGENTGFDLIRLIDSPDHPPSEPGTVKDQTTNMAEWYIGEMVTAVRWGREGKILLNGRYVHMNQYQAYDWLLFKKRYQLAGIGRNPINFAGANGIWTNEIVQAFLPPGGKDTVTTLIELAGGMTQEERAGFTVTSWMNRYGTGGNRHKVLALFNPLLEYFWNERRPDGQTRAGDFVRLIRGLNEIPVSGYQPLMKEKVRNPGATLRHDEKFEGKSVIKTIEDKRLLSVFSRSHGADDNGLLAPSLGLLIRIIEKLSKPDSVPDEYKKNNPDFRGNTALDVLFDQMNIKGFKRQRGAETDPVEEFIDWLFVVREGGSQNLVSGVHRQVSILGQALSFLLKDNTGVKPQETRKDG
ncbi:MAG: hypothetical protein QMD11_05145 [Smithella sp.]|nr:hypothetical protein [Smithella sp.]